MDTHYEIAKKRVHGVMSIPSLNSRQKILQQDMYLFGYLVAASDHGVITQREYQQLRDEIDIWVRESIRGLRHA